MPHVTLKASFVAALSKAWTGAWMRKALLARAFVCLSVGLSLAACTRSHPRLDELVALCGVHSQDARGDSVAVVVDENGKPHAQGGLSFKVFPAQLAKGAVAIDRACVRFAPGKSAGAVVLVSTDDGRLGAVLNASDFADESVKPVSLRPIESRVAFETCGVHQKPQGRLLRLFRAGGEPVMHDGAYLQALNGTNSGADATAKKDANDREASPVLSPLGCLSGNANDVWLVQSRDGAQASYIDRESWNAGRVFLDDRMPAVAFKTCRVAFTGRLREELLASKWLLAIPAGRGVTDSGRWSVCGRKGGCAKSEWATLTDSATTDISGVTAARAGRCVASARTSPEFILRADDEGESSFARITAPVSEQNLAATAKGKIAPSQQPLMPRPFTMAPYLSATAFARDVSLRLPQCIDGQIRTSPKGALEVALGIHAAVSTANAVFDGRIAIALANTPLAFTSGVPLAGSHASPHAVPLAIASLPADVLRAAESETPPVVQFVATDVFGQSASVRQDSACALRIRSVTFPSLAPIVNAYTTTHDVSSVLTTGIPTSLSDGTRLRVAYRLADRSSAVPADASLDAGAGAATRAAVVFHSAAACIAADGFREATDGLIPLTTAGRYRLEMRVCADNGEASIAPSRAVHVDGVKPVFDVFFWSPVAGLASPLITRLGETLRLRIRDLHDDILPFDELVAGVSCKVKIVRPGFELALASKCRVVRSIAPYGEVQVEVDWLPLTSESDLDLQSKILGSHLRVFLSVPTGDERGPVVTHWKDFVVPSFLAGGWRPLTLTLPADMKHKDVMAVGSHSDGGALMMTNDMRIWRSLKDDGGWALVARATSSYPGIRKYDGGTDPGTLGRGDIGNPDPVVEELDTPGRIYDIGQGQIALSIPQSNSEMWAWKTEPNWEESPSFLGSNGPLPWMRAVCQSSVCKSGQELRNDLTLPWIETTGTKWIAIDEKEIRVGEVGVKGHRTYRTPPGLSRSAPANSLIIDPFDRVWQYDPSNEWKLKRIVDLVSQREVSPDDLFPLLASQDDQTRMSFVYTGGQPLVAAWNKNKICWNRGASSACFETKQSDEITNVEAHGSRVLVRSYWTEGEPSWATHPNWFVLDLENAAVLARGSFDETYYELFGGFVCSDSFVACWARGSIRSFDIYERQVEFSYEDLKWKVSPDFPLFEDTKELTIVHTLLTDGRKILVNSKLRPWVESSVTVVPQFENYDLNPLQLRNGGFEGIEAPTRIHREVGNPVVETFSDAQLILDKRVFEFCVADRSVMTHFIDPADRPKLCADELGAKGVVSNEILSAFNSEFDYRANWLFFSPGLRGLVAIKSDGSSLNEDVRLAFYFDGKLVSLLDDNAGVQVNGLQSPYADSFGVPRFGAETTENSSMPTQSFLAMTSTGPALFDVPYNVSSLMVENAMYENANGEISLFTSAQTAEDSEVEIMKSTFRRVNASASTWMFVESKAVRCSYDSFGADRGICLRDRQRKEEAWFARTASLPSNGAAIEFEPRWPLDASRLGFAGPLSVSPSNFEGAGSISTGGWSKVPLKLIN